MAYNGKVVLVERVCDLPKEPFWGYEGKSLESAISAYCAALSHTPYSVTAFIRKNGVGIYAFTPTNNK